MRFHVAAPRCSICRCRTHETAAHPTAGGSRAPSDVDQDRRSTATSAVVWFKRRREARRVLEHSSLRPIRCDGVKLEVEAFVPSLIDADGGTQGGETHEAEQHNRRYRTKEDALDDGDGKNRVPDPAAPADTKPGAADVGTGRDDHTGKSLSNSNGSPEESTQASSAPEIRPGLDAMAAVFTLVTGLYLTGMGGIDRLA